jgi:hypothetical protein
MSGAIAPEVLLAEKGTVLVPLADIVGGGVNFIGTLFIILSLGLATIHVSFGLYFTVQERIGQLANLKLFGSGLKTILDKPLGRFGLGVLPVILSMLSTLYLLQGDSSSFSALLSFLGVVSLSLLGGIYPIQLLLSSRFRGNVLPGAVYKILGNRILIAVIYIIFLSSILVHGLFIWSAPIERLGAILVGIFTITTTYSAYRGGAFKPRIVVEIRKMDDANAVISIISAGEPSIADVLLDYVGQEEAHRKISEIEVSLRGLRMIHVAFDTHEVHDLEIWIHYLQADNSSIDLGAKLQLASGNKTYHIQGKHIVPIQQAHYDLRIQVE